MDNADVAQVLNDIALLLEIKGENPFKIRSYANASALIQNMSEPVAVLVQDERLREVEGIGEALEQKITELVTTGKLAYMTRLRSEFPDTILDLLQVDGLGPKSVRALYEHLGIATLDALQEACAAGKVREIPGFSEKREQKLLDAVAFLDKQRGQFRLNTAWTTAATLRAHLLDNSPATQVEVAGSLRRYKEVVKDIDLLAAAEDAEAVMQCFVEAPDVKRVVAQGATKSAVMLNNEIAVDLRVVAPDQFACALLHFTGSKAHNVLLRRRAAERNLKLNEYGLFHEDGTLAPCDSEAALYDRLDLPFLPPEVREGLYETELTPPIRLVEQKDVRGMVHCHSTWSDGKNSIAEMAAAAAELGYEYLVMTDHSQSSVYVNGLSPDRVMEQQEEIDALNKQGRVPCQIIKGIEADILRDGALDYDPALLERFAFVIASVHSNFDMTEAEATQRIIRAIENPYTSAIGHLTGRLLLTRRGYSVDVDKVVDAAVANGVAFEINANPRRLDMDWRHLRRAAEKGTRFVIGPDAHRIAGLHNMRYGLGIARKGALAPEHILNCLGAEDLVQWRKG